MDSPRMLRAAASRRASSAAVKLRFQSGSVEEVSFLGAPIFGTGAKRIQPPRNSVLRRVCWRNIAWFSVSSGACMHWLALV